MYLCRICDAELKNIWAFLSHLRWWHTGVSTKDYYDRFFKKIDDGICKTSDCSNKCNFYNLTKGYHEHCSRECTQKDPGVNKKKAHDPNPQKARETCIKKYGVSNVSMLSEIQERKESTSLKNNGYKYYVGSEDHKKYMREGGAAYCNMFIKEPSKSQVKLFRLCQEILPYPIMNYPCLGYAIDIAVSKLGLAIEHDGSSHTGKTKEYDQKRQKELEEEGWIFLRYIDRIPTKKQLLNDLIGLLNS